MSEVSLFSDLFRYRQRPTKLDTVVSPLEDFLTECLASCLKQLDAAEMKEFLSCLTGCDYRSVGTADADLVITVHTQFDTRSTGDNAGIPDILILADGSPWIVLENKVAHAISIDSHDVEATNQISRYAKWLANQPMASVPLQRAAVLITWLTIPPPDFRCPPQLDDAYGGLPRRDQSWGGVSRLLKTVVGPSIEGKTASFLVDSFESFLRKNRMSADCPSHQDLGTVESFLASAGKIDTLVNRMFDSVSHVGNFHRQQYWPPSAYPQYGYYSASKYLVQEGKLPKSSQIMVGIWYPEQGSGWLKPEIERETGRAVTASPKLFYGLLTDGDDGRLKSIVGTPDGWCRPVSDLIVLRDFAEFAGEGDDRLAAISVWLHAEAAKLEALLRKNATAKR